MKNIVILSLSALFFAACSGGAANQSNAAANRQTANTTAPPVAAQKNENSPVISSHSSDQLSASNPTTDQPSGSSMGKPVDVSAETAKIEKAEKDYKAKPDDEKVKKALASAYFDRAFALTKAAQYRSALGDFRKGLKLNPDDKEASAMHDQIIEIFSSMKREPPKEGEEPPPMPFKK